MDGKRRSEFRLINRGEAIGIALAGGVALFLFDRFDAFERLVSFVHSHEEIQLDEILFTLSLGGVAALFIAIRRSIELQREIAAKIAAEQRALQLARHDPLTGLPNRRVLDEDIRRIAAESAVSTGEFAVFLIDLDRFKPVNDLHGHDMGDELLIAVASRLRRIIGTIGNVYRLGGDEFVCVVSYEAGSDVVARHAHQIVRALSEPFSVDDRRIGASVGVARRPLDGETPQQLLRCADVAMYEAKRAGRDKYRVFHAEMDERFQFRSELEGRLRSALSAGEIVPYFQPIIDLGRNRIAGFEALARWIHPSRGVIGPDDFIEIAEDLGLIDDLSDRVLRTSATIARDWPAPVALSINISPVQLQTPGLAARILSVLAETGLKPGRLIVEVTENAIIADTEEAAKVIKELQAAGVRTALDDFGKGYSSLSHLRELRFNHLKIDQSFVHTLPSAESQKIVAAVASLGRALGMGVVAEGVETQDTAQVLQDLGCTQAQGYLFGRPMPAKDTISFVMAGSFDTH